MSGTISSDDAQKLLEDRVKFKLYAAKQHLDRLKKYQTKPRKHMRSSEIRVKTEMEIDCFLANIIGAKDSLLVQINQN